MGTAHTDRNANPGRSKSPPERAVPTGAEHAEHVWAERAEGFCEPLTRERIVPGPFQAGGNVDGTTGCELRSKRAQVLQANHRGLKLLTIQAADKLAADSLRTTHLKRGEQERDSNGTITSHAKPPPFST